MSAAIERRIKNITEKIYPPGIFTKTPGRVWKINPGPAAGSNQTAKTAVKIAIPAIIAINVSKKTI